MSSKQKAYIVVGKYMGDSYTNFLKEALDSYDVEVVQYNDVINGAKFTSRESKTVVLYSGGADVNPDLYAEQLGKHTRIDKARDRYESEMFSTLKHYTDLNVGICRGSQFLTVMSGGSLIQHVEGHCRPHDIIIPMLAETIEATSTHHQMMYPYELPEKKYELLAWSKFFKSETYLNGRNEEISLDGSFLEPEIVYYNNTSSLAIQGHPEMVGSDNPFRRECGALIRIYLEKENKYKN